MYQLAIFDLDGTLVNSIADLGGTANRLLEQRGLPTIPGCVLSLCGERRPQALRALPAGRHTGGRGGTVLRRIQRGLQPPLPGQDCTYAGIPEVLEQLRSAGVHIAVASNKTQPLWKRS